MIAFLLGLGGKILARPAVMVGLVSVLALGGMSLKHRWQVRGLNSTIAKQAETIKAKEADLVTVKNYAGGLEVEIKGQNLKAEECKAEVAKVNAVVAAMQSLARSAQARASASALEAELAGQKAAEAIRSGHVFIQPTDTAVNQRLREMFP